MSLGYWCPSTPSGSRFCQSQYLVFGNYHGRAQKYRRIFSSLMNNTDPEEPEESKEELSKSESEEEIGESFRENLERIVGADDATFSGIELATLIRNKYGRSYDVQLIKKEFLGRNLLALNVMWKYMEQRSFPLTEEEYILRLDDVANTLKCWGAVSHIRNSLAKLKERPRIGKAVSIFIDMDESGGRSNEWIYK
ncbi:hypothetical protein Nepgr_000722 [Nepenthes gracilis]|uniref:Uncharacterized protein n=1 Tax=Nepenthes gracilis TaxID=150966 RepID=A0AAD3P5S9_NEPGR|nr:hypothetical protein Nepgr_000722 [Nepenthes gracilis]